MSINTKLIVSQRVQPQDVVDYMNAREDFTEVDLRYGTGFFQIIFVYKGGETRMMSFHSDIQSLPVEGHVLSLNINGSGVEIMKGIADVFGGLFTDADTTDVYTMISGMFNRGEGFNYFLKNALISGQMSSNRDAKGLIMYIRQWERKHGTKQIRWRNI